MLLLLLCFESCEQEEILKKQRDLAALNNDVEAIAEITFRMGQRLEALELLGKNKRYEKLQILSKKLSKYVTPQFSRLKNA